MKAIAVREFGGVEKLQLLELPTPEVGPEDVLVEVHAAGVNPVDGMFRAGYAHTSPPAAPVVMGSDFAGRIVAVGARVRDLRVGEEVYGYKLMGNGTYAELAAVPAQWVARKPSSLSYAEAAALPCVGLTAYRALHHALQVQQGETVLITAAAGGVGSLAVQMAAAAGARVIGTASARNAGFLRELGVTEVIDYTQGDVAQAVRRLVPAGVDAALASLASNKKETVGAVRDGGRMTWLSGEEPLGPPMERNVRGSYSFGAPGADVLDAITALVDAGKLRVVVEKIYPLADAAEAQTRVATGHVRGKLVIAVH